MNTPLRHRHLLLVLPLALSTGGASALELSGEAAVEVRHFPDDPRHPGQFRGSQTTLSVTPEIRWEMGNGDRLALIPHVRHDSRDDERSDFDLREAYWLHIDGDWEWLVGVNRSFWGVTESRHLVDIVNQTDEVAAFDGEEKLGQPMINLTTRRDWGSLGLFVLPGFLERTFAGPEGRLRPAQAVDTDRARYESGAGKQHIDLALRYAHYIGDWDIGLHTFHGTGREPRLISEGGRLVPHYDQIRQVGLDLQYTREAWLWKLEALTRRQNGDNFNAVAAGFEYTLYQIVDSNADLGLLAEYLYDGRNPNPTFAPPTPFDNDLFLGARFALNDTQDTALLVGVVIDRDDHSRILSVEAERRLGSHWTVELEGRWFKQIATDGDLAVYAGDSFVSIRLARHF